MYNINIFSCRYIESISKSKKCTTDGRNGNQNLNISFRVQVPHIGCFNFCLVQIQSVLSILFKNCNLATSKFVIYCDSIGDKLINLVFMVQTMFPNVWSAGTKPNVEHFDRKWWYIILIYHCDLATCETTPLNPKVRFFRWSLFRGFNTWVTIFVNRKNGTTIFWFTVKINFN